MVRLMHDRYRPVQRIGSGNIRNCNHETAGLVSAHPADIFSSGHHLIGR
jgi:hypothetical protein